jgi:halocyanin-like protein
METGTYEEWMSDVPNYESIADKTGESEIEILVGDEGGLVFGPPAVEISTGTTVTWTWTGKGGSHNVAHDGGAFKSEMTSEEGHTFSHTFSDSGLYKYYCVPHQRMGMKGVISVVE